MDPPFQYRVKYCIRHHCVFSMVRGTLLGKHLSDYLRKIGQVARYYQAAKVVHDFRHARMSLTLSELYQLHEKAEAEGVHRLRRAILYRPGDEENFPFLEATLANRGHRLRAFDSLQSLAGWMQFQALEDCEFGCIDTGEGICILSNMVDPPPAISPQST